MIKILTATNFYFKTFFLSFLIYCLTFPSLSFSIRVQIVREYCKDMAVKLNAFTDSLLKTKQQYRSVRHKLAVRDRHSSEIGSKQILGRIDNPQNKQWSYTRQ